MKYVRMFLKSTIFALFAVCTAASCTSHRSMKDVDLLTHNPWKYEKAGFGSDDDGIFNALDPVIAGKEKDDLIVFCKDGTGYKTGTDSLPFMWAFQNNDSTIYFQDQYYKVRVLTRARLEMYADQKLGGNNTRYTIILTH